MHWSRLICLCVIMSRFLYATAGAAEGPSLDELLNLSPPKNADAPPTTEPTISEAVRVDPVIEQNLVEQDPGDLFSQAIERMEAAARRLAVSRDAGVPTQRVQEEAMAKLDQLIAEVQKNAQQFGDPNNADSQPQDAEQGSSGNEPQNRGNSSSQLPGDNQPNPDTFSPGQVRQLGRDGKPLTETRREWGNLPAHLRDELLQGLAEPFSPVYRALTEAYYRRLAEEGSK